MIFDEGTIKFNCGWIKSDPLPTEELIEIKKWRDRLFGDGLIGVSQDEIGYGNVSIRIQDTSPLYSREEKNAFIISGTQTGEINTIADEHFTRVLDFDLGKNQLICKGPVKASSESLTHGAIYQEKQKVHAIIHTHHKQLWESLKDKVPTTQPKIPYGTPEMAREMIRLFDEKNSEVPKILVMAGHEGGIITFGSNLDEAGTTLYEYFNQI